MGAAQEEPGHTKEHLTLDSKGKVFLSETMGSSMLSRINNSERCDGGEGEPQACLG